MSGQRISGQKMYGDRIYSHRQYGQRAIYGHRMRDERPCFPRPFKDMMSGESLDSFHQRCVVPTSEEITRLKAEVNLFVLFLHAEFNRPPLTVANVVKAGSLGKGTAVRGSIDIDLVVFFNGLSSIQDLENWRPRILRDLETQIKRYRPWIGRVELHNSTRFSVSLKLDGHEMDILPAFDVIKAEGVDGYHRRIATYPRGPHYGASQFSASLAPLQVNLVKPVREEVKTVIRLLKFWKKERGLRIRSYTLELITIHASRSMAMMSSMTTQRLFQHVLNQLQSCGSLRIAFQGTINRPYHNYIGYMPLLWIPPYVMDPVNPYMNTLDGVDAQQVSGEAAAIFLSLHWSILPQLKIVGSSSSLF